MKFRLLGGACAALGWGFGMVLSALALLAEEAGQPFLDVVARVELGTGITLATQTSEAIDLLFLAIAVWEGYKLSSRQH